jgi:thiol-disulfide isomerase/thioredoxin
MKKVFLLLGAALSLNLASAQVFFSENFNAAATIPTGWSQTTLATDGGWKFGASAGNSSQYFTLPSNGTNIASTNDDGCNCDKSVDRLVTPSFDLSAAAGQLVYLKFDSYYFQGSYNGAQEHAYVKISTDGGTNWTTVQDINGNTVNAFETYGLDLSNYAGQANVKLAFEYNDGADWLYGWALDNIEVYQPVPATDLKLAAAYLTKYIAAVPRDAVMPKSLVGKMLDVQGTVKNTGTVPITSFDIIWNNGTPNSYSVTGVNILPFATYDFKHSAQLAVAAGVNNVSVTIGNVNGAADADLTNNNSNETVTGVVVNKDKKVVAEEGTGTWCGWCPRGAVYMDYMAEEYPTNFIGIAVHNGTNDPMKDATYDTGMGGLISGYPSGAVDRIAADVDPSTFETEYLNRISLDPGVTLDVATTFDATTRVATIFITANFTQAMTGEYRFNAVVVEDSVHGTAAGYAQTNYYAGGGNGPMGGFENLASPVPAAQMNFNHVGRTILGGFNGTASSITSPIAAGSTQTYLYTYTVPAAYNINQMKAVGWISKGATASEIINAKDKKFTPNTGIASAEVTNSVIVAPNPMQNSAEITMDLNKATDVTVEVMNSIGQVVASRSYGSLTGTQILPFSSEGLANGLYTLNIKLNDQIVVKRVTINK